MRSAVSNLILNVHDHVPRQRLLAHHDLAIGPIRKSAVLGGLHHTTLGRRHDVRIKSPLRVLRTNYEYFKLYLILS